MKHILFIVTSINTIGTSKRKTGYEFSEVADPYFEFVKKGYTVDFASISGGTPPEDGYDPLHSNSFKFKESKGFKRLNFSHKLSAVDIEAYDAIFFPGGLGPMIDIKMDPLVKEIIRKVYENGGIIGALCHGPAALLDVWLSNGRNLLEGKQISSFTEAEEQEKKHFLKETIPFLLEKALVEQGALFSSTQPFEPYFVADGNLITGQNPASASPVAQEMINLLEK